MCGLFTYAISKKGIEKLFNMVQNENIDTDVITKFLEKANLKSKHIELQEHEKNKAVRLTLDYTEDLEFFRKMYQELDTTTSSKNIIKYLNEHKTLPLINFHKQKDFLENQKKFNMGVT